VTSQPELSIVVAIKDATGNLPTILAILADAPPDCEIVFCVAGENGAIASGIRATVLTGPADALIPHLWRDGILVARARRVALTTAQCIPAADWAKRMRYADVARWAGVGGSIENDFNARASNWAIFFLRYSAFAPPLERGPAREIAADNAVYDRDAILACPDLLAEGFWEPSFHRRFHEGGRSMLLDPGIVVTHHGLVAPGHFTAQRLAHGYEFGLERGSRASTLGLIGLLLCSPLVPLLILLRIVRRVAVRAAYRRHLLSSLPWLLAFALAWSAGEARGYVAALSGKKQR
jgi:hypothetical protein